MIRGEVTEIVRDEGIVRVVGDCPCGEYWREFAQHGLPLQRCRAIDDGGRTHLFEHVGSVGLTSRRWHPGDLGFFSRQSDEGSALARCARARRPGNSEALACALRACRARRASDLEQTVLQRESGCGRAPTLADLVVDMC